MPSPVSSLNIPAALEGKEFNSWCVWLACFSHWGWEEEDLPTLLMTKKLLYPFKNILFVNHFANPKQHVKKFKKKLHSPYFYFRTIASIIRCYSLLPSSLFTSYGIITVYRSLSALLFNFLFFCVIIQFTFIIIRGNKIFHGC